MNEYLRWATKACAARCAVAGVLLTGGTLIMAAPAAAEPATPPPVPVPGPPPVPAIPNPEYSQDVMGQLGSVGDLFSTITVDAPLGALTVPPVPAPGAPPGAGASPPLPPGTVSLTAPESSTAPPDGVWLGPLPGMAPVPLAPPAPVGPAAP